MSAEHTISPEVLLAETDWLRALARQLVRDRDHAEDLFQDTVVAGLRDGASARGPLRPWLAGVARHLAGRRRRTVERTARRERAAARPEATPSAADSVARFQAHRRVAEAVEALPAGQHEVLVLRYFEDLPPREIAARLDLPVETVKTRLKRGLANLRERLDAEYGDRSRWTAALLPLLEHVPEAGVATMWAVRPRLLVVAAFVIGAITAVFGWLPVGGDTPPPSEHTVAGAAEATENVPARDPEPEPGELRTIPDDVAPAGDASGLRVQVVDGRTGEPVAGARVHYVDARTNDDARTATVMDSVARFETSHYDAIDALMPAVRTDATGIAALPRIVARYQAVCVVHGELEGMIQLQGSALGAPLRVELWPRREVDVIVVDELGEPVPGVAVAWGSETGVIGGHFTRDDGRARLQLCFSRQWVGDAVRVALHVPLLDASESAVMLELTALPETPVRLVLPATGSLDVTAVDENGRALRDGTVTLHEVWPDDAAPAATIQLVDGHAHVAHVAHVGTGTGAQVRVHAPGWAFPLVAALDGLGQAGERASVRVAPSRDLRVAVVRVLDADGEPLAGVALRTAVVTESGTAHSRATTDADAFVRIRVDEHAPGEPRRIELTSASRLETSPSESPRAAAMLDLRHALAPGFHRLPDVRLADRPILARGRVVDGDGEPIPGVVVELCAASADGFDRVPGVDELTTGVDGTFTFRGTTNAASVRLRGASADHVAPPRTVATGHDDVTITMTASGGVAGRIACAHPLHQLYCLLEPLRVAGADEKFEAPIGDDGSFRFRSVPPGRYELQLSFDPSAPPLARRAVEVTAGDVAAVPAIELDELVRGITLTLVNGTGAPLPQVFVRLTAPPATDYYTLTDDAGEAFTLVPRAGVTVHVNHGGFHEQTLQRVDADRRIVLVR